MIRNPFPISTWKAFLILGVALAACSPAESVAPHDPPVIVEEIDGSELSMLTLSESAADRLDIQTTTITAVDGGGLSVTSDAVIIDPYGIYWVYTVPEPLVYIRQELINAYETNGAAYFEAGPAAGTEVVTVGVPELYGAEFGIGK